PPQYMPLHSVHVINRNPNDSIRWSISSFQHANDLENFLMLHVRVEKKAMIGFESGPRLESEFLGHETADDRFFLLRVKNPSPFRHFQVFSWLILEPRKNIPGGPNNAVTEIVVPHGVGYGQFHPWVFLNFLLKR